MIYSFIDNYENRRVVQDICDEYDLDLIYPEIFLRFLDLNESFIKTWDDVERETQYRTSVNISITKLKQQYKWCGIHLKSRGYTDFDDSKL